MDIPTHEELAALDDEELEYHVNEWRGRAARGEREAFGIAHALEVELRRRVRDSRALELPVSAPPVRRPWWRFWDSDASQESRPS